MSDDFQNTQMEQGAQIFNPEENNEDSSYDESSEEIVMPQDLKPIKLTKAYVKALLPKRIKNSHKGTYGSVLNIAGSLNYPGAGYLSSISALKVGAGKVTLATTTNVIPIVASLSSNITYINLGESNLFTIPKTAYKYLQDAPKPDVYSIGCGLTLEGGTKDFILTFVNKVMGSEVPVIIDADAINAIATTFRRAFPLNSIITPHPLELARLWRVSVSEIEENRIKYAWEASRKFDTVVLLKGFHTIIAVPNGKIFVNTTGNSGLAKAGTGDVLTGMIAGFCAQGLNIENAACLAAYLHGRCGELASKTHTEYGVLAPNLINYIPVAIKELAQIPITQTQQEKLDMPPKQQNEEEPIRQKEESGGQEIKEEPMEQEVKEELPEETPKEAAETVEEPQENTGNASKPYDNLADFAQPQNQENRGDEESLSESENLATSDEDPAAPESEISASSEDGITFYSANIPEIVDYSVREEILSGPSESEDDIIVEAFSNENEEENLGQNDSDNEDEETNAGYTLNPDDQDFFSTQNSEQENKLS